MSAITLQTQDFAACICKLGLVAFVLQPCACNCRMPNIGELSLYDVVGTPGVAADVSHMDSKPKVKAYALQLLRASGA